MSEAPSNKIHLNNPVDGEYRPSDSARFTPQFFPA